jgi:CHASE2 domain-containing sensor protein
MLDRFFQNRSPVGIQNRIAIIAIEDRDIQTIKQYPISDGILAKAIAILKKSKPRAIGLDIYRDLPVQPGEIDLNSIFANTSNLVGINKIVSDAVAPPSILAKLDRVGFADQILDSDGKVRRALLSLELDNQKLALSFALKLSLIYLKAENIEPKILDKYQYQIGKSILVPFEKNDGGYVRADAGGYQVLLNFYGPQSQFKTFSLSNLLAEKIPPRELTDRIILIGYTAESVKDLFQTPYTNKIIGYPEQMSGVIVHANIISQLLHGALEGRPWLKVWSKPIEYLWIWGWAICGAFLSWRFKSSQLIVGIILLATVILLIFCYLAFLMGWWIPIVPAVLSLIGTATILPIIISRQLIDKARVYQTVQFLLNSIAEQPIVVKIALEYLKESETKENQLIIVKLLEKYEDSSNNY